MTWSPKLFVVCSALALLSGEIRAEPIASIISKQQGRSVLTPEAVAKYALPYAAVSDAVYSNSSTAEWERTESWIGLLGKSVPAALLAAVGLTSGFNAQIYKNTSSGEYVLSFEGTNFWNPLDWKNNFEQALGLQSSQYMLANLIAAKAKEKYGNLVLTGHSLGGGLAQSAALSSGLNAVTFNAAGLNYMFGKFAEGDKILNISLEDDPVSTGPLGKISNQIGTQYVFANSVKDKHGMASVISTLDSSSQKTLKSNFVKWANVELARGKLAGIISGNVSPVGSANGNFLLIPPSDSTKNLFVSGSPLGETEWILVAGDPSLHLGSGKNFGSITNEGRLIYSLNNEGLAVTTIKKDFQLGATNSTISLSGLFNFVTTEFPVFTSQPNNPFNDGVKIRLISQAGQVADVIVFTKSANDGGFKLVQGLPSPLAGNNPNDAGGQTGFILVTNNMMTVAAGSVVTLEMSVTNVGDTALPSAILTSDLEAK